MAGPPAVPLRRATSLVVVQLVISESVWWNESSAACASRATDAESAVTSVSEAQEPMVRVRKVTARLLVAAALAPTAAVVAATVSRHAATAAIDRNRKCVLSTSAAFLSCGVRRACPGMQVPYHVERTDLQRYRGRLPAMPAARKGPAMAYGGFKAVVDLPGTKR